MRSTFQGIWGAAPERQLQQFAYTITNKQEGPKQKGPLNAYKLTKIDIYIRRLQMSAYVRGVIGIQNVTASYCVVPGGSHASGHVAGNKLVPNYDRVGVDAPVLVAERHNGVPRGLFQADVVSLYKHHPNVGSDNDIAVDRVLGTVVEQWRRHQVTGAKTLHGSHETRCVKSEGSAAAPKRVFRIGKRGQLRTRVVKAVLRQQPRAHLVLRQERRYSVHQGGLTCTRNSCYSNNHSFSAG